MYALADRFRGYAMAAKFGVNKDKAGKFRST